MKDRRNANKTKINYKALLKRANGRYFRIKRNTKDEWFNVKIPSVSIDCEPTEKAIVYLFEVDLFSDSEEKAGDILNLRYYFICTERILHHKRQNGENALFILLINTQNNEDMFRVSSYLYLQSIMRNNMLFYVRLGNDDTLIPLQEMQKAVKGIGHLPPLLCIGVNKYYLDDMSENKDEFLSYEQISRYEKLEPEHIKQCYELAQSRTQSNNGMEESKQNGSNLTILEQLCKNNAFSPFQLICAIYLTEILIHFTGTKEHPLKLKNKMLLSQQLYQYILDRHLETIAPLTALIWLILLRYLKENKELIIWDEVNDKSGQYTLNYFTLEKSYDSICEYVDGILQLIENSCQHTQNGFAYLSIRIHYVNRACSESMLSKVADNRHQLINRYSRSPLGQKNKDCHIFPDNFKPNEGVPYYFELCVADDARYIEGDTVTMRGIPTTYAINRNIKQPVQLYKVFGQQLAEEYNAASEDNLQRITYHYGVRQLQKNVLRNGGCFFVSTPGANENEIEIYSAYYEKKVKKTKPKFNDIKCVWGKGWQQLTYSTKCVYPSTEYQIFLPIGGAPLPHDSDYLTEPARPLDLSVLKQNRTCRASSIYDLNKEFNSIFDARGHFTYTDQSHVTQKKEITDTLEQCLNDLLNEPDESAFQMINVLDFSKIEISKQEFATKALFLYIGHRHLKQKNNVQQQLYAVLCKELRQMQAFIMDFSVFYNENGQCPYMEDVQIAVCGLRGDGLPEVCFLLAGTDINVARQTASIFAYHNNTKNTRALLPQLQNLTNQPWDTLKTNSKPVNAFPFDLYLKEVPKEWESAREKLNTARQMTVEPAPANQSWFMNQIADMISKDLRTNPLGCKINDVHVRLGSKIHIDDFYEAELMFQNISMVARFAYLIVEEILKDYRKPGAPREEPLLILGYETYSTILLEYVVKFLKACRVHALSAVYGHNRTGTPTFFPAASLRNDPDAFREKGRIITINPIGTTFGTIYHMIDSIPREYKVKPWLNFSVLMVASGDNGESLQKSYWSYGGEDQPTPSPMEQSIVSLKDDKQNRDKTIVRYYLKAKTKWHDPQKCVECENTDDKVLVYVDPTSTVPNMIFPLMGRKNDGPDFFLGKENHSSKEENDKYLALLKGCIHYGHILVGNDHFLYYLDLPLYFEHLRSNAEIRKKYKGVYKKWAKLVDADAFNIIVAPLENGNAAFVQTIADEVFAHSIRILRIPILDARKEDIRAKYSFIGDEYRKIKQFNPYAKIHLYYVSLSIVTGETFHRAAKLIGMLLSECANPSQSFLFHGIFTLVNQSSYSSVRAMVPDPEKNFHAFLHLSVPHYNIHKGVCPGCLHEQQSQRIIERCVTSDALNTFTRWKEKQVLRTPEEHRRWLSEEFMWSSGDFKTLCQWLYFQNDCLEKVVEEYQKAKELCLEVCKNVTPPIYLRKYSGLRDEEERELKRIWLEEVVQERALCRVYCTHRAYCVLESDDLLQLSPEKLVEGTEERILDRLLLNPKDNSILPKRPLNKETLEMHPNQYIEWVISYIKVLSRGYLSYHHNIRQAIYDLMTLLLKNLLGFPMAETFSRITIEKDVSYVVDYCKKATPLQRYQLILILMRQLAAMQANIVIRQSTLERLERVIKELNDEQKAGNDELRELCPLPSNRKAELDYIRCVKLCMLSGDEENNSLLLHRQCHEDE